MRATKSAITTLASIILLLSAFDVFATPPTPTSHFYGDADGDLAITGLDLIQHKNFVSGQLYSYSTLQAPGPNTDWNTCDVDSDRTCTGLDLIILGNVVASKSNYVNDGGWSLINGGLPATVASASWTPFFINVTSNNPSSPSGRPGITVVAEVVSGNGKLGGRACNPNMAGARDQYAPSGATCALSVTQTDWTVSTSDGKTESGASGFTFIAPLIGTTEILFTVNGNPALDMPTTTLRVSVYSDPGCTDSVALSCPGAIDEQTATNCTMSSTCVSPCADNGSTCSGVVVAPDCSSVIVPAQGESAGPGSCTVSVAKGIATDTKTISITEVNVAPIIMLACSGATENASGTCTPGVADADIPNQTLTCSNAGSTCSGVVVAPSCWIVTVAAQGEAAGPGTCNVSVAVSDGVTSTTITTPYNISEINVAPDFTELPKTADCVAGVTCNNTLTMTDPDLPSQTLTCSVASGVGGPGSVTVVPTARAAGDTANDIVNDAWAEDATAPLNSSPADNTMYQINDGNIRMELTAFDTSVIPANATITGVTLNARWGVGTGVNWAGTGFVQYNGLDTTIQPNDTIGYWNSGSFNLFAAGVDTIPEVQNLIVGFTNNDPSAGTDYIVFDVVNLTVSYSTPIGPADTCGWGTLTGTPGPSGTTCAYNGTAGGTSCSVLVQVGDGATTVQEYLSINVTILDHLTLNCPANASENAATTCTPTYSGPGTCSNTGSTCAGVSVASDCSSVTVPAQGEAAGPGSCTVAVTKGYASDTDTIAIAEINIAPTNNAPPSVSGNELTAVGFNIAPTDPDLPLQTLTCSVVSSTCAGGALVGCSWSWTATEAQGPASCSVVTRVGDGVTYSADVTTAITINEVNVAPTNSAPATVTGNENTTLSFTTNPSTDPDVPTQTLTCSFMGTTCAGVMLWTQETCTFSWTPTESQGPSSCQTVTRVSDGVTNTDITTTLNALEVNVPPTNSAPASVTGNENSQISFTTNPSTDPDLPPQTLMCALVNTTCTGAVSFVSGTCTFSWTPSEAQAPGSCQAVTRVSDGMNNTDVTTVLNAIEVLAVPVFSTQPTDIVIGFGQTYNQINGVIQDSDLPASSSGQAGYVTCTLASTTCGFSITVTGAGAGTAPGVDCNLNFVAPVTATTCDVTLQATDGWGVTTLSNTFTVTAQMIEERQWTGTSVSNTVGGIRGGVFGVMPRIINNYPANWNRVTLNFSGSITSCGATVTCGGSATATTTVVSGSNCVVSASAGYWPSNSTCVISNVSSNPSCSDCAGKTDTFYTSLLNNQCGAKGGLCGGFIDDGTFGSGNSVSITVVDPQTGSAILGGTNARLYTLYENPLSVPIVRIERFDDNNDGTIVIDQATDGLKSDPAKITVALKGKITGMCDPTLSETPDCRKFTTLADVDSRTIKIGMERTTANDWSLPEVRMWGYVPVANFLTMVGRRPLNNTFPNPMRAGIAMLTLKDQPMATMDLNDVLRTTGELGTLSLCLGTLGMNLGGLDLPGNLLLPDLRRQRWNASCSGSMKMAPANTTYNVFTNRVGTTQKIIVIGASVGSKLFSMYRYPDVTALPITFTALGTQTVNIPTVGATTNMGDNNGDGVWDLYAFNPMPMNTPLEYDFRDGTNGNATGQGRRILMEEFNLPYDEERIRMGVGATPAYGDPNRAEGASHSGQFYTLGGQIMILGGRAGSDGFVPMQYMAVPNISDAQFTVFQRQNAQTKAFADQEPWGTASPDNNVISSRMRGIPSTNTDTDISFSSMEYTCVGIVLRPYVESSNNTAAIRTPGRSAASFAMPNPIQSYAADTVFATTNWLPLPEITDPTHAGYIVPQQDESIARAWPINRNGQIVQSPTLGSNVINTAASGARYFTLRNPITNGTARRAHIYEIDIIDVSRIASGVNVWPRGKPDNKLWKIYGSIGNQATLTVTLPFMQPRSVTIEGVSGKVPDPFEGANFNGQKLSWALTEHIIDTGTTGINREFDFQDFDLGALFNDNALTASESFEFYWQ